MKQNHTETVRHMERYLDDAYEIRRPYVPCAEGGAEEAYFHLCRVAFDEESHYRTALADSLGYVRRRAESFGVDSEEYRTALETMWGDVSSYEVARDMAEDAAKGLEQYVATRHPFNHAAVNVTVRLQHAGFQVIGRDEDGAWIIDEDGMRGWATWDELVQAVGDELNPDSFDSYMSGRWTGLA